MAVLHYQDTEEAEYGPYVDPVGEEEFQPDWEGYQDPAEAELDSIEEDSEGETEAAFQVLNEYVHNMPEEEAEAEAHHQRGRGSVGSIVRNYPLPSEPAGERVRAILRNNPVPPRQQAGHAKAFEAATTGSAAASLTDSEAEEAEAEAEQAEDYRRLQRAFDTLSNEAIANDQLVLTEDPQTSGSVSWLRNLATGTMEDARIKPKSREELGNIFSRTGGSGDGVPDSKSSIRFAFCQTCLNRGFQLKLSLSVNLALAWKYRSKCTFYLVVFNENSKDSQNLLTWISTNLKPALDARFLRVATGEMPFWDCSVGKNTAHKFAMTQTAGLVLPECLYLVNLDGDNVMKEAWLSWLFSMIETDKKERNDRACVYKGDDGGCTGRVGIWANIFQKIKGYDEELPFPSGYEDIEILHRCAVATKRKFYTWAGQKLYPGSGYSIPNHEDPKTALGLAKFTNSDPGRCRNLKWGQQNSRNMQYAKSLRGRQPMEHHGSFSSGTDRGSHTPPAGQTWPNHVLTLPQSFPNHVPRLSQHCPNQVPTMFGTKLGTGWDMSIDVPAMGSQRPLW